MRATSDRRRSWCPISTALEMLGDRWSLLIVRDLLFSGYETYKQLLSSEEGIATNVLADRLERLESAGIVTRERDPKDGRRVVYRLTARGIDLAPVLLELGVWGVKYERGVGPTPALREWSADRESALTDMRARWRQGAPNGKGDAASAAGADSRRRGRPPKG
jgi:DNA-binding HxlR family transcriptional regulator